MANKATVLAVVNQKGGTGKTTTCENLGVGLAQEGKKVLLVDVDPQGSLTISLGYPRPDDLDTTLSELMAKVMQETPLSSGEGILHHEEGVDLIPANISLSGMEVSLVNAMSRETILKQLIDPMKCQYDFILLDCMPSLGMLTVNALAAADNVLIPVHHCETCNRTFIGEETLKFYENRFGKLAVCVTHDTSANSTGAYGELNSESLLHKLGYNVVEGELSQTERRKFLIYLIEGKKISFFQACRDIENAIKIFEYRPTYRRAVQRWREDLAFINEYMENNLDGNL